MVNRREIEVSEGIIKLNDKSEINYYLAKPADNGKYPAIIIVHEIWGLEDNIKSIARRWAEEGYVAFAPHLFASIGPFMNSKNIESTMVKLWSLPREKMQDEKAIGTLMNTLNEDQKKVASAVFFGRKDLGKNMIRNLDACFDHVQKLDFVKSDMIGTTGFCFGGGLVFQYATLGRSSATVVFYGANPDPIEAVSKIDRPIIAFYGGEDYNINQYIPRLMEEIVRTKKSFHMKIYEGAQHAFFNDTRPTYNKDCADDAWELAKEFFRKNLGGK